MNIMLISNNGAGFADNIDIQDGITIQELFTQQLPNEKTEDYLIRVNRQVVPKDYILKENDRVTFTPSKIEGAVC